MLSAIRILVFLLSIFVAQGDTSDSKEPLASATVGAPAILKDVILPGSELVAKPLAGDPEMVVQIVDSIAHGDSFRYTIRFSGLEPGKHNLAKWLKRKDGSENGTLPKIPVEIESLLPAGQITPNELPRGWLPNMGGYKVLMWVAAGLWSLVLIALIFVGRRKKKELQESSLPQESLADLLKTRLEAAFDNKVPSQQYAELERMLFSMWRRRLGFESLPVDQALAKIKANPESGPLIIQLENWMHRPRDENEQVDLAGLLEPYRNFSVDELEPKS